MYRKCVFAMSSDRASATSSIRTKFGPYSSASNFFSHQICHCPKASVTKCGAPYTVISRLSICLPPVYIWSNLPYTVSPSSLTLHTEQSSLLHLSLHFVHP